MFKWEGAGSDLIPSMPGSATARWGNRNLNELRDPCIFSEDGVDYLLYTFNGEGKIIRQTSYYNGAALNK